MRTEKIRMNAPYVYLAKGIVSGTYDLFIIVPVGRGKDISLTSISYESQPGVVGYKYTKLHFEEVNVPESQSPETINYSGYHQLLYPETHYTDFAEGGDFVIEVNTISMSPFKTHQTKVCYCNKDENLPLTSIAGVFANNVPYTYLLEYSEGRTTTMIPYVILTTKQTFVDNPNLRGSYDNVTEVYHQEFNLRSDLRLPMNFIFDSLHLNTISYPYNNNSDGFFLMEIGSPNRFSALVDKKKVKIRNKDADQKPR